MDKVSVSIPTTEFPIKGNFFLYLLIALLILSGILVPVYTLMNDPNNRRDNSEQNNESNGNGYRSNHDKLDIKIDAEKKMHQLGDHFNKHGRSMGYSSKNEYGDAALKFAQENCKNPKAQIFEATWNGPGNPGNRQQIAICFENKTIILNRITGQIVDFYEGVEMRGLINIIKIQ